MSNGQTTLQALTEVEKQATFLSSPLHQTFLLGRARFTAQPLSALLGTRGFSRVRREFSVLA